MAYSYCESCENSEKLIINTDNFNPYYAGMEDSSFVLGAGFNQVVRTGGLQSDGKLIVAGDFTDYSGNSYNRIIRLNQDTTVDTSFVIGTGFNDGVSTLEILPDGKILVGGFFTQYSGVSHNRIVRLNSDGSIDNSFSVGSGFNQPVNVIKLQSDGKILVGGYFTQYSGASYNRIIRLNSDGSIDNTFSVGVGFNEIVQDILIQNDGKILVGGDFTSYKGITYYYIIRLNSDGSIDMSFLFPNKGFNSSVYSLDIQQDGKIIVGGDFNVYDYSAPISVNKIIRLNSDGSVDVNNFELGLDSRVYKVLVLPDGKILAGGTFVRTDPVGFNSKRIIRFDSMGNIDTTFSVKDGFNGEVRDLIYQSDGKLFVTGGFSDYNTTYSTGLIRLYYDSTIYKLNNSDCYNTVMTPYSGSLILDSYGFLPSDGYTEGVHDFEVLPDNKKILVGIIQFYSGFSSYGIVKLNSDNTFDQTFNYPTYIIGGIFVVKVQTDNKILLGGSFTDYSGASYNRLIRLNSDGTIDNTFSIGTGFNTVVWDLEIQSDGKILVGGNFTQYSGASYNRLIRLNSDGSIDNTFLIGTGLDGFCNSVKQKTDGTIFLGGDFSSYSGVTNERLVKLNSDGTIDNTFTVGGFNDRVRQIKLTSDDKILVCGDFYSYNSYLSRGLIRLNSDGSIDTTNYVGGFNGEVYSVDTDINGNILVGGYFQRYSGVFTKMFASLYMNTETPVNYNAVLEFNDCEICKLTQLPRSANTESFICEICCPCTTGETINLISPPHPVWTDGYGTPVTQLNMVVLGGENGLNN